MATVTCNFVVPATESGGGRLTGAGFGPVTPRLNGGDSLQIVVTWAGQNQPTQLNGYVIISPAEDAPTSQTAASPFVIGSSTNPLCFWNASCGASGPKFNFPLLTLPQSVVSGMFELTFVAENPATSPATQWSIDPEFDTGG